jgi:hypothetical protein
MKKVFIFLSCALISAVATADCQDLFLTIQNDTNDVCTLTTFDLNHGHYTEERMNFKSIPAHTTALPLYLTQTVYGPEITMSFDCGNGKTVTIYSQQNYCSSMSGDVTAKVLNQYGMKATYTAQEGDYAWGQSGSVQWVFSEADSQLVNKQFQ